MIFNCFISTKAFGKFKKMLFTWTTLKTGPKYVVQKNKEFPNISKFLEFLKFHSNRLWKCIKN